MPIELGGLFLLNFVVTFGFYTSVTAVGLTDGHPSLPTVLQPTA
jgi:hypothetical protein